MLFLVTNFEVLLSKLMFWNFNFALFSSIHPNLHIWGETPENKFNLYEIFCTAVTAVLTGVGWCSNSNILKSKLYLEHFFTHSEKSLTGESSNKTWLTWFPKIVNFQLSVCLFDAFFIEYWMNPGCHILVSKGVLFALFGPVWSVWWH